MSTPSTTMGYSTSAVHVRWSARLKWLNRNYPEVKLQENLDTEIMEVLLEEAHSAFDEEIVIELRSDTTDEMESNLDRIEAWVKQWKQDNAA